MKNTTLQDFDRYIKLDLKEYQKLQLNQLEKFTRFIAISSSYYKSLSSKFLFDINSYSDFSQLPLLEQSLLKNNNVDLLRAVPWNNIVGMTRSSGSTGNPKMVLWTKEAIRQEQKWGTLGYLIQKIKPGDRIAIMIPFELSRKYSHVIAMENIGAFIIPIGRIRTDTDMDNAINLIQKLEATHIKATPTRILQMMERIKNMNLSFKDHFQVKTVLTAGQIVTPTIRKQIEESWNSELYDEAGANEFSFIGFECGSHNGIHIMPFPNYVEVVDMTTHKPITDSTTPGEIIVTNFMNLATPLLRYRIGDLGIMIYRTCSCSLQFPRLKIIGRTTGTITLGGTKIYALDIEEVLVKFIYLSNSYQIIIAENNNITTVLFRLETDNLLVAKNNIQKIQQAIQNISTTVNDKIQSGRVIFQIELISRGSLPRSSGDKIKDQFIDKRS